MKNNSILVHFSNLTNFQNFVNAEKLDGKEKKDVWQKDIVEKTLTLPMYLAKHVEESDYVDKYEETYTEPPEYTKRTDDLDIPEIEIAKCPQD